MTADKGKRLNIVLGITGGIAAYKSAELVRLLKKERFEVKVIMTENAARFITPLTMSVLSENKVYISLFSKDLEDQEIRHISLARWADLLVIAPASANLISKLAHGVADDLLSTTSLAFQGKVIIVPAMNKNMLHNPIFKDNVHYLLEKGFHFVDTDCGSLACGEMGQGRMAEPWVIVNFIKKLITDTRFLIGKKILITAGTTREPIDKVRFISNYSSGKMGFSLAQAAKKFGAEVVLISGPTYLADIEGITTIRVETAEQMREQVLSNFKQADIFISAAAVSDFRPVEQITGKLKKEGQELITLKLKQNTDIIREVAEKKDKQIIVGFAAEVENLKENAQAKLKAKRLDYIIANDVSRDDSGFEVDTNKVLIMDKEGNIIDLPLMSKYEVAEHILKLIGKRLGQQNNG